MKGCFHIIPYDANETLSAGGGPGGPGGPGFGGGPRGWGVELDPLVSAKDTSKPLLSKLLAVPSLRTRYLGYVRDIAEQWLDWNRISPLAREWQALINDDVKSDTRKLDSFEAFQNGVARDAEEQGGRGPRSRGSLKAFVEQRRATCFVARSVEYLCGYTPSLAPRSWPDGAPAKIGSYEIHCADRGTSAF